jgi:hypothetical protein
MKAVRTGTSGEAMGATTLNAVRCPACLVWFEVPATISQSLVAETEYLTCGCGAEIWVSSDGTGTTHESHEEIVELFKANR